MTALLFVLVAVLLLSATYRGRRTKRLRDMPQATDVRLVPDPLKQGIHSRDEP